MPMDAEARQILIDARKMFLNDLFSDCSLQLKNSSILATLGWMNKDIYSIRKNISSIGGAPTKTALAVSTLVVSNTQPSESIPTIEPVNEPKPWSTGFA